MSPKPKEKARDFFLSMVSCRSATQMRNTHTGSMCGNKCPNDCNESSLENKSTGNKKALIPWTKALYFY